MAQLSCMENQPIPRLGSKFYGSQKTEVPNHNVYLKSVPCSVQFVHVASDYGAVIWIKYYEIPEFLWEEWEFDLRIWWEWEQK